MRVAVRPGEGVGRLVRAFPRLLVWLCLLALAVALLAASARARASVYQCQGPHGETVYTGHPHHYGHCRAIRVQPQRKLSAPSHATPPRSPAAVSSATHRASAPAHKHARHHGVQRGAVYRIVRADGSIEYTNVKPRHGHGHAVTRLFTYINTCAACALHSSIDWATVPLRLTAYGKSVRAAAASSGVDAAFLRAVIHAESAFNPNAVSSKGAEGLMQLMPGTASDLGVTDAFDAAQNIQGGARYLAQLLKDFKGDRKLAAAAYNAGPEAVHKYHGVPPYAQTRVYVKRVGLLYKRYHKALDRRTLASTGQSS